MKKKIPLLTILASLTLVSCGGQASDSTTPSEPSNNLSSEISSEETSSYDYSSADESSTSNNSLLINTFIEEINKVIEIENTDEKVIEMLKTQSEIHKLPEEDRKQISNLDILHEEMRESEKIIRDKLEIDDTYNDDCYYTIDIERMVNEYVKVSINRNFGAISFEIEDMEYIKSILLCIDKVYIDVEKLDGKDLYYTNGRTEFYDFSFLPKSSLTYSYSIKVQSNGYVYVYPYDEYNESRMFVSICQIDYEEFSNICNLEILFDKRVNQ